MLSYLMLYICSADNKRVVLRKAGWKGELAHLFCKDGVFRLEESQFQRELERPEVLYVLVLGCVTCFLLKKHNAINFLALTRLHNHDLSYSIRRNFLKYHMSI